MIPFSPFVATLRSLFRYKLILTSHGSDVRILSKTLNSIIWKKIIEFTISNSSYYSVVSRELKETVLGNYNVGNRNKVKVISMGIPFDKLNQVTPSFSKGNFTAVFVGRLSEIKGTRFLLYAIHELKQKGELVKCKIIGDGNKRKELEKLSKKLNIVELVEFTGFISHNKLSRELNQCSVLVGPSITTQDGLKEGFGLVFIEAMAAGIPVIASDSGGIPDIVKHNETGLLVEEKDYKKIAEYVITIRDNKELRERLIRNGLKLSESYSWENIAKKYLKLYE